jgi:GDP-fucose transporter C1
MSLVGVSFGVASSAITALHSVVIKKALDVVKGSALDLSWYTNLLSAVVLLPLMVVMGELPEVMKLFFESGEDIVDPNATFGVLGTFLWGSLITVSLSFLTHMF